MSVHALDAERALLGGLLVAGQGAVSELAERVASADFARAAHARIWDQLLAMAERGEPVELTSLLDRLQGRQLLEECGGLIYVTQLGDDAPAAGSLIHYADTIRDRAQRRRLEATLRRIQEQLGDTSHELPELLAQAEEALLSAGERSASAEAVPLGHLTTDAYARIRAAQAAGAPSLGHPTGYIELDRLLGGLAPTDLVVLAARPAMGKTALAQSLAHGVAERGGAVLFFSLEMGRAQVADRALAGAAQVPLQRARRGQVSRDELGQLLEASERLHTLPIQVDDRAGLTVAQVRAASRRWARMLRQAGKRPAMIVVDYIGLMGATDPRTPREQQVAASSRGLKALAKELEVAVLCLAQLNRGVEARTDKRPLLSDLRESGAIEQDADSILFIYRDEYYNKNSTDRGVAEVIVAKQRNGPTGTARLAFIGELTRFENLYDGDDYV